MRVLLIEDEPELATALREQMTNRVAGLDQGADHYLAKPFALEEALARTRAVRRRSTALEAGEIRAGRLVFDPAHDEARIAGERLVTETT